MFISIFVCSVNMSFKLDANANVPERCNPANKHTHTCASRYLLYTAANTHDEHRAASSFLGVSSAGGAMVVGV